MNYQLRLNGLEMVYFFVSANTKISELAFFNLGIFFFLKIISVLYSNIQKGMI